MSILSLLGISTAHAATTAAHHASPTSSFLSMLPLLIAIVAVFYFLIWRPQQKRTKEQRAMLGNIAEGDEIITSSGIVGRLKKIDKQFIVLSVAKELELTMQKNAIASVLPKGTMDSVKN